MVNLFQWYMWFSNKPSASCTLPAKVLRHDREREEQKRNFDKVILTAPHSLE